MLKLTRRMRSRSMAMISTSARKCQLQSLARHLRCGWRVHSQLTANPLESPMFGFYSNQLGCLGSIVVAIIRSVPLIVVMRSCSG